MNRNYRPGGLIKAKLVYRENKRSLFLEYIFRRSIWDLPELVLRRTQNLTIIGLEKNKIEQIYIGNSVTTGFATLTLIYIINMEFLTLRRRRVVETTLAAGSEERRVFSLFVCFIAENLGSV